MAERRGLPIAAHLGLLLALAIVSSFVVNIAVLVWFPPRPSDVMRADQMIDAFAVGYAQANGGALPDNAAMRWRIVEDAPDDDSPRHGPVRGIRDTLEQRLHLTPDRVRFEANFMLGDTFVFRVRDAEHRLGMRHDERWREERRRQFEEARAAGPPEPSPSMPPPGEPAPPEPGLFAPPPPGVMVLSGFSVAAQLDDGRWLTMRQGRNLADFAWLGRVALVLGGTLVVLSLLALWFARRLALPIRGFADAVQAVGVDPQSAPVQERGPSELRSAARAVNTMQARLRVLIGDRTKTLATVAHDMRTPLMRMRLAAENIEPVQRERIVKEIGEVEALVASFIAFARDDPAEEARVRLDLSAMLQSIADDQAETGRKVSFEGEERFIITGQALGLKRLFSNVVDNAVKYGGAARVALRREGALAIIDIADDGPGVPEAERETVFEPFVRLTRAESGAGLGLPAARGIARAHGGDIVFIDAEKGALARVTLPA
jgi:two-component system OmpR family sensor kinase